MRFITKPIVKTNLPFNPRNIRKPNVPRAGINPKRKFLDNLTDDLLKKPKGNVVAPKPTFGPRVNPGFKPKPTMVNLPVPKIDKGGAVVCPNSA